MPTCKTCNTAFSNSALIEGKVRNFQHRTQCLICLPFNPSIRGKRPSISNLPCVCQICGRHYLYNSKDTANHSKKHCNSCVCNSRRHGVKQKAVEYLGGCCKKCGYSKCIGALTFHHTADSKDFQISDKLGCSWEVLQQELDKCELLCANCHHEVHWNESRK